jgi:hypothetical protein
MLIYTQKNTLMYLDVQTCAVLQARGSRSAGQPPTACITATRNLGVKRCGSWYISPRVRCVHMQYPEYHEDGSEGIAKFFGWSKTERDLTKAIGQEHSAQVRQILQNTKSGPGKEINDFKQVLKTIKANLNIKMQETAGLNKDYLVKALNDLMGEAMPIIQKANDDINNIKPKQVDEDFDKGRKENNMLQEDGISNKDDGNFQGVLQKVVDSSVTGDVVNQEAPNGQSIPQPTSGGFFTMAVLNDPWGGPVQMRTTNSCAPNARVMCTPMPVQMQTTNSCAPNARVMCTPMPVQMQTTNSCAPNARVMCTPMPVQMQTTNSCAPNARVMCTPMPVRKYCVVHGLGGAQRLFSSAACEPWQSALRGAQEGDYAQPQVCCVMAR